MCDQAVYLEVMGVTLSRAHLEIKDSWQDCSEHPYGSYEGLPLTELS